MSGASDSAGNVADATRRLDTLLQASVARLRGASDVHLRDGASLEAQLLLAHVAGVPRALLLSHGERLLGAASIASLDALVARRLDGEPLAYLLGEREFWSLSLRVTRDVLVPRPETELLVERTLALLGDAPSTVLDLGTGSGAIALALASERAQWQVAASDVSTAALDVARDNAQRLGLARVRFIAGEWFAAVERGARYDAIVSKPPYVDPADPALAALRAEPRRALVAAEQGLADLRSIVQAAPGYLRAQGWLLLEHGATQAQAVRALLVGRGFGRVRSHRDLAGLDRITEAQWAPIAENPP